MTLAEIADAIARLPASSWLAGINWLVPTVQSVHIFAIAVVFTAVLVMSARLGGVVKTSESAAATSRRFMPWAKSSLVVLLLSGSLLILIEPQRQLLNSYFQAKMILVLLLLFVLAVGVGKSRTMGFSAVILLLVIIWCGRWIAYTQ